MYDVDDAVAKIDGYIISIAGAAAVCGREADGAHRPGRTHRCHRAAAGRERRGDRRARPSLQRPLQRAPANAPRVLRPRLRALPPRTQHPSACAAQPQTARSGRQREAEARREAGLTSRPRPSTPSPRSGRLSGASDGDGEPRRDGRGWPTIQASASWPQGRTAPFGCQGQGDPRIADSRPASAGKRGPDKPEESRHTDMYAIVKTGGKQYRVERGQKLLVERLAAAEGAVVAARAADVPLRRGRVRQGWTQRREGDRHDRCPRPWREAAGFQVQAQARLQTSHRPPPGPDQIEVTEITAGGSAKASGQSEQSQNG